MSDQKIMVLPFLISIEACQMYFVDLLCQEAFDFDLEKIWLHFFYSSRVPLLSCEQSGPRDLASCLPHPVAAPAGHAITTNVAT